MEKLKNNDHQGWSLTKAQCLTFSRNTTARDLLSHWVECLRHKRKPWNCKISTHLQKKGAVVRALASTASLCAVSQASVTAETSPWRWLFDRLCSWGGSHAAPRQLRSSQKQISKINDSIRCPFLTLSHCAPLEKKHIGSSMQEVNGRTVKGFL